MITGMCALHESQLWPNSRDLYDAWGTKEIFFCGCKKPDLNVSFIIYTYIPTIYIFKCINTLKVLNIKLIGSLSDKCTFTFFTFKIPTNF